MDSITFLPCSVRLLYPSKFLIWSSTQMRLILTVVRSILSISMLKLLKNDSSCFIILSLHSTISFFNFILLNSLSTSFLFLIMAKYVLIPFKLFLMIVSEHNWCNGSWYLSAISLFFISYFLLAISWQSRHNKTTSCARCDFYWCGIYDLYKWGTTLNLHKSVVDLQRTQWFSLLAV